MVQDTSLASSPRKGMLKIFFGYAAGVGKTTAMLKAAHAAKAQGIDIVAGYVEPHPRPETSALLDGLEQLPLLRISYRNVTLNELDVDAALARKPEVLLVDELAHTNAHGSRNTKRYQDVEEILRAGISVWTTVNVQHLESLNDLVASITGVVVRERLPDNVFDQADQVELVDIEPKELILRLKAGKIYREKQAQRALEHFFLPANLTGLREIALRRMADRVNRAAQAESPSGSGRRQVKEHILICLSGAPSNARVIRTAARMTDAFHADFTALYVQNSEGEKRSKDPALLANVKLAEELGAVVVETRGSNIPARIAEYAKLSGVSKIVLGRSPAGKHLFRQVPTLVERLAELAPEIDIYIIPDSQPISSHPSRRKRHFRNLGSLLGTPPSSWKQWGITGLILCLCSAGGWLLRLCGVHDIGITGLYMFGVLGIAAFTAGPWYGAAASAMSVLLFDCLFVPPLFSLSVYDLSYFITFTLMFLVALSASALTSRTQAQAQQSIRRATYTELMLTNSRRLQQAENEEAMLTEACRQFRALLGCHVVCYPVHDGALGRPQIHLRADGQDAAASTLLTRSNEKSVAQWVMKNNRPAGAGTDTLPGAFCHYIPIAGHREVFAVFGFARPDDDGASRVFDAAEKNLVLALSGECALAIEKERLIHANAKIRARVQQEKLHADVLRTISHDLRTPLTSIYGNAAMLSSNADMLPPARRHELADAIEDEARYLVDMVENILALTRLEQYGFTLRMEAELVEDVVQEAVNIIRPRAGRRRLKTEFAAPLLLARMDARLTVQVLVNLLDNAIRHSPEDSSITIRAIPRGKEVVVEVADEGSGIPKADKEHIFEMFYTTSTGKGDGRRGMGIGLALCRSIIQAMGGEIGVRDNMPVGTVFFFNLQREAEELSLCNSMQE